MLFGPEAWSMISSNNKQFFVWKSLKRLSLAIKSLFTETRMVLEDLTGYSNEKWALLPMALEQGL